MRRIDIDFSRRIAETNREVAFAKLNAGLSLTDEELELCDPAAIQSQREIEASIVEYRPQIEGFVAENQHAI